MHVYDGCMTYDHADWKWNDWWTYYDSWMTDEQIGQRSINLENSFVASNQRGLGL
jgi:hypothetical protein